MRKKKFKWPINIWNDAKFHSSLRDSDQNNKEILRQANVKNIDNMQVLAETEQEFVKVLI